MIYVGIITLIGIGLVGIWVYQGEKERKRQD
jgi:hypothetical protein